MTHVVRNVFLWCVPTVYKVFAFRVEIQKNISVYHRMNLKKIYEDKLKTKMNARGPQIFGYSNKDE